MYSCYNNDKYNEIDSKNIVDESIDEKDYLSEEFGLQLVVGKNIRYGDSYIEYHPHATLGFLYDLKADGEQITYKDFSNNSEKLFGPKRDRANFNIGLGTEITFNHLTVNLNYNLSCSKHSQAHIVSVKCGYLF